MRKSIFLIILTVVMCGFFYPLKAQKYMPGETAELREEIQNNVSSYINERYLVMDVMNVDSMLGFRGKPGWRRIGPVENPYGTLTNCFIFNASTKIGMYNPDSADGIIGIFKNGQILWHSGDELLVGNDIQAEDILSVWDANNDGKVEIFTVWSDLSTSLGLYRTLWIVSWDGTEGTVLNARDTTDGQSVLKISSNANFSYADVEGDGIWEVVGETYPVTADDSSHVNWDKSIYIIRTFSWNGSQYGLWPQTPQPYYDSTMPSDRVDVNVKCSILQENEFLYFNYSIESKSQSIQHINRFAIGKETSPDAYNFNRNLWNIYDHKNDIKCVNHGLYGFNLIKPGEIDNNLSIMIDSDRSLPGIVKFYFQGWNGNEYFPRPDIYNNSFKGSTIGLKAPPDEFISFDFADTLITYTNESYDLGWITDQTVANKYTNHFQNVKNYIQQNNIQGSINILNTVLQEVEQDNGVTLSSEAYALLKYNSEYLKEHNIPAQLHNVDLRDSQGSLLNDGSLKYYEGGWQNAVDNGDGTFQVNTEQTTVS
ncbi:MAG: hypothetical protein GY808_06630, partial [Gammaproteobacteria bacterium]|nr:hypothetical protein [Gammaproteobacteria bacterium]